MRLTVVVPEQAITDEVTTKILAEGPHGHFCLLPRHVDWVTTLVPGILTYVIDHTTERYLAVDEGLLVKCGAHVHVAVRRAIAGQRLGTLRQLVTQELAVASDRERAARSATARLEAGLVRRFLEFDAHG